MVHQALVQKLESIGELTEKNKENLISFSFLYPDKNISMLKENNYCELCKFNV
jgi:hypothetical protein